jgi:regulator of sirC expression with transglutaminase-like and TPR domain
VFVLKLPLPMAALTFQEEIRQEPVDLPRAALRLAQEICYPALDVASYLLKLDSLAVCARQVVSPTENNLVRAEKVAHYLFHEAGFRGNTGAYNDPRNSYLNEVFDRRLGIPITLSALYIIVGQCLDLPVHGVSLPGHFIASVDGPNGPLFLDPYHGGRQLTVIDCARLVELSTGYTGPFRPEWLQPAHPLEILLRMLHNLRNVYIQQDNWHMALPVLEHLRTAQPKNPDHLRDLGIIHNQLGSLRLAMDYFERYLVVAPDAADAALVRRNLQETALKISRRN